jgi:DNA-binding Lrp family transcriptional regulator
MNESVTIDTLDRQLIQALQIAARAPFSRLAEVLGASEQTIARRYRRLSDAGVVRILVLPATPPGLDWYVRIGVRPGAAGRLAEALAERDDVAWVSVTSGGAEVVCVSRPSSLELRDALLLERLPRTNAVTSLEALAILNVFSDGPRSEWSAFGEPLAADQIDALELERIGSRADADSAFQREPGDAELLALLRDDGRATYSQLAAATGIPASRVARRVEHLLSSGAGWLDIDLAIDLLGFPTAAILWLSVPPSELQTVGRAVAGLPTTAFTAAVSGRANLTASVACRDTAELYRYISEEIGAIRAIASVEVSPVIRRVKQASSVLVGRRLPPPAYR